MLVSAGVGALVFLLEMELSVGVEVAAKMFLAEKTVKYYVSNLLAKLGLEWRTQAAVLATRLIGEHPRS
jgi:hypothetical protein